LVFYIQGEEYKLFWPEQSEFVRMAARFGAKIIPFGTVGEDDIGQVVSRVNIFCIWKCLIRICNEHIFWWISFTTKVEFFFGMHKYINKYKNNCLKECWILMKTRWKSLFYLNGSGVMGRNSLWLQFDNSGLIVELNHLVFFKCWGYPIQMVWKGDFFYFFFNWIY